MQLVIFIKTPKVHRLSVRNLDTGNIAETVKTKRPKHRLVVQNAQLLYHGVDVFNLYILL